MSAPSLAAELGRQPLLTGIGPEPLGRLAARARLAEAAPGGLVLDSEDENTDVYFVLQGEVRVSLRTPGGKEVIVGDFAAGDFFGEMAAIDAMPRSARIAALTRARLAVVPASAFLELLFAAPEACHRMLRLLTTRIRQQNARLLEHAALPARLRLHAELLRLARPRADGRPGISPPPVQSDLAARIGVRREAVSREIAALRRAGVVEMTRGALVLADPDTLRRAVELGLAGDDA